MCSSDLPGQEVDKLDLLGAEIELDYALEIVRLLSEERPDQVSAFGLALLTAVIEEQAVLAQLVLGKIGSGEKADALHAERCPEVEDHGHSPEKPGAAKEIDTRRMHEGGGRVTVEIGRAHV